MDQVKKNKKNQTQIDFGSYSDLFMVMAFVFLLMYVISTLNSGITIIQEKHKSQQARAELQTKVARYEQNVEEALNETQKREYQDVKAGLEKLQAEAREARLDQERQAKLALEKEKELEKFQESVKTMAVIQARANQALKTQQDTIAKTSTELQERNRQIASLEEDLTQKSSALTQMTQEIQTRETEIQKIQSRVKELSTKEVIAKKQNEELKGLKKDLEKKEQELASARETEAALAREKEQLASLTKAELEKAQAEKNALAERTQAEKESLARSAKEELEKLKNEKNQELSSLQEKYRRATEGLRKEIAGSLAAKLKEKGIFADVNKSTGDVTVRFTNAYFEYNSSVLKEEMKKELESFIPIYAQSLFENKKFAASISSVEIVGSASPSFKGHYVNPRAMASDDEKNAMNYNLDLSYRRAKKIFEHAFLSKSFDYDHKGEMIPLIKVTGTGYLQAMEELTELPPEKQDKKKGFCGQYDCQAFQKVTLRFNLKDKVSQK